MTQVDCQKKIRFNHKKLETISRYMGNRNTICFKGWWLVHPRDRIGDNEGNLGIAVTRKGYFVLVVDQMMDSFVKIYNSLAEMEEDKVPIDYIIAAEKEFEDAVIVLDI